MKRRSYPSDLTEQEWAMLEPLIPPAKPVDTHEQLTSEK